MTLISFIQFVFACAVVGTYVGFFGGAFVYVPPLTSSDFATWAGAIGAVAAVVGAGLGIRAQLRHTEKLAQQANFTSRANVINALHSELMVYETALKDISDKMATNAGSIFGKMLQLIFPSGSFRFPVYLANAAHVWAISDEPLRSKVIGIYAEMDMFFALLDRNSAAAMKIRDGQLPADDVESELKQLHPLIDQQLAKLLPAIALARTGLMDQIRSRLVH